MTRYRTIEERYWEKVDVRGEDECWPWIAGKHADGYGKFSPMGAAGNATTAHRVGAELSGMEIDGLHVHHRCHNKLCQNPRHFEIVTVRDHLLVHHPEILDALQIGRRAKPLVTRCKHGHELTPDNIYFDHSRNGNRIRRCRTCVLARQKAARRMVA